ncbi:MAG TPA: hypothetical protein VFO16_15875 [Pseudonocardiaceae bacterium]|nr:hypothetical protein [Pseudonocardiaceae bacterium]
MTDSAGKLALWSISDEEEVAPTSLPLLRSFSGTPVAFDRYRNQVGVITPTTSCTSWTPTR